MKIVDMTGQKVGHLTVLKYAGTSKDNRALWECSCECGSQIIVPGKSLRSKNTQSCGCSRAESARERIRDLTNHRFGKLVARYPIFGKGGATHWMCDCDCGGSTTVSSSNLIHTGQTKCKECHFKATVKYPDYPVGMRTLFARYKNLAAHREIKFELSIEEVSKLTRQSCHYCGLPPSQEFSQRQTLKFLYTGIDRIDSARGYTSDNVVPCCGDCNVAKLDRSVTDFLKHIERIYIHQQSRSKQPA